MKTPYTQQQQQQQQLVLGAYSPPYPVRDDSGDRVQDAHVQRAGSVLAVQVSRGRALAGVEELHEPCLAYEGRSTRLQGESLGRVYDGSGHEQPRAGRRDDRCASGVGLGRRVISSTQVLQQ